MENQLFEAQGVEQVEWGGVGWMSLIVDILPTALPVTLARSDPKHEPEC